jgi:phage terminase small subunit
VKPKDDEPESIEPTAYDKDDPLSYLMSVVNSDHIDEKLRVRAAIAAAQYKHTKKGDGGKKEEKAAAAKEAGKGRFGVRKPPLSLVAND